MENCTQTQAVGGLRTVISPQQFKTKRLHHPRQTLDTERQCVTKEHMEYRDDKIAQVRIKQLSSLDRGLEKQQFYSISLISVSFGCNMLKTKFSPSFLGYSRSPPPPSPPGLNHLCQSYRPCRELVLSPLYALN